MRRINGLEETAASGCCLLSLFLIAGLWGCEPAPRPGVHDLKDTTAGQTSGPATRPTAASAARPTASWENHPPDPSAVKLPDPASALHPNYTFKPIEKTWTVEVRVGEVHGDGIVNAQPAQLRRAGWYTEMLSAAPGESWLAARKIVYLDSDGVVRGEVDADMRASDAGQHGTTADISSRTTHVRTFHADGSISSYSYWTGGAYWGEGKVVDKSIVGKDGRVEKLENGRGMLHWTYLDGTGDSQWYYQGTEFLKERFEGNKLADAELKLIETGEGLSIYWIRGAGHEEALTFLNGNWRAPKGKGYRVAYPPGGISNPPDHLIYTEDPRYGDFRTEFLRCFSEQVAKAGFKVNQLGLETVVPDLAAIAAEPATQPTTKPATVRPSGS